MRKLRKNVMKKMRASWKIREREFAEHWLFLFSSCRPFLKSHGWSYVSDRTQGCVDSFLTARTMGGGMSREMSRKMKDSHPAWGAAHLMGCRVAPAHPPVRLKRPPRESRRLSGGQISVLFKGQERRENFPEDRLRQHDSSQFISPLQPLKSSSL